MSRNIKYIVIHCSATPQDTSVSSIHKYWKNKLGWKNPGYHYIIRKDGSFVNLLSENKVANGVKGYNSVSVHVCYIGGVDEDNNPIDNRTHQQQQTLVNLLKWLREKYPKAKIRGHRDFPNVSKACPSFDAKSEYSFI